MARIFEYDAQVTKIIDGDTIHVDMEIILFGRRRIYHDVIIRFKGVDTPERGRPGYYDARTFTSDRLLNRFIVIKADMDEMNGDRLVAIPVINGTDFCQELIEKEMARVWYPGIKPDQGWPDKWTS